MNQLENFLLLVTFQVLLFSAALLLVIFVGKKLFRARVKGLIVYGLAGLILFWFVALVPVPSWSISNLLSTETSAVATNELSGMDNGNSSTATGLSDLNKGDQPQELMNSDFSVTAFLEGFAKQVEQVAAVQPIDNSSASSWKSWFALVVIGGITLGIVRWLAALYSVHLLRRSGRQVSDPKVTEVLDIICAKLNYARTVRVRESCDTSAAFTVGWRKPLVMISDNWHSWSDEQIEATLAHEVAHISEGDFFQRVIAQASAALNFYNPLVHILCSQLNLEQELSADDRAAEIVGGRASYLDLLATMALKTEYPKGRLFPMFLPTRKTFFRRIEMLRKSKVASRRSHWITGVGASLILLIGISVAGLRLPAESFADEPAVANHNLHAGQELNEEANLRFVNRDTDLAFVIRPAMIYSDPLTKEILAEFPFEALDKLLGVKSAEIDQLTWIPEITGPNKVTYVIQTVEDGWWSKEEGIKSKVSVLNRATYRGMEIIHGEPKERLSRRQKMFYHIADNRTLVMSTEAEKLKFHLRAKDGPKQSEWVEQWSAKSEFSFYLSTNILDTMNEIMRREREYSPNPMLAAVSPFWEQTQFVVGSIRLQDKNTMSIFAQCSDDAGANQVTETLSALIPLGKNVLKSLEGKQSTGLPDTVNQMLRDFVDTVEIKSNGDTVHATAKYEGDSTAIANSIIPVILKTQKDVKRVESMNNLRLLSLALLNYESSHRHFPPAVLTSPAGKKYSWRIEILPFIEANSIYEKYRFDEEWDSPHNSKVTAQVPSAFAHPDSTSATAASYFAVVGEETIFTPDGKGATLGGISDGTSNTILLVEAKRDIHWAKPQDIEFAKSGLLESLGGFHAGEFAACRADGSVVALPFSMGDKTLTELLTARGGEVIGQ